VSNVNYRETKTYQADDGRKVQELKFSGSIGSKVGASPDLPFDKDDNADVFVGMNIVDTPIGARQITFSITGVSNIQEAFDKYDEFYEEAFKVEMEEVQNIIQELINQNEIQIPTASEIAGLNNSNIIL